MTIVEAMRHNYQDAQAAAAQVILGFLSMRAMCCCIQACIESSRARQSGRWRLKE
jgi:hypothetical protein